MFISVTRLQLKGYLQLFNFFRLTFPAFTQAQKAPGNVFARTHNMGWLTYGTVTGWENEAAMRAYIASGPHLAALKASRNLTVLLQSTHYESDVKPTWPQALALMDADPKSIKFDTRPR